MAASATAIHTAEGVLRQYLEAWLRANRDKIDKIAQQKGGWENWAQVELALFLTDNLSDWNIHREYPYLSSKFDFQCIHNATQETIIIELKVESIFQSAQSTMTTPDLVKRLGDDVVKLKSFSPISGLHKFAVGITAFGETTSAMKDKLVGWSRIGSDNSKPDIFYIQIQ